MNAYAPLTSDLSAVQLNTVAGHIQRWLDSHAGEPLRLEDGPFPLGGEWSVALADGDVTLWPAGRAFGQSARIGQRIAEKIARYAPHVTDDLHLMVAIGARGWTITRHQVVEALLGKQVVTLSRELDDVEDASSFDGHGSVVPFGPVGTSGSTKLAGTWILSILGIDIFGQSRQTNCVKSTMGLN
ncbi:MAG: hypothetical protein H0U15_05285 [Geodermatophilaceae bacterium]|nr:hypothetical protein [Geodermatophilaceae bacterium]